MESDQKNVVSAVFEGAIHMGKKQILEHAFGCLIMYTRLHLTNYKVGVGSYQSDSI